MTRQFSFELMTLLMHVYNLQRNLALIAGNFVGLMDVSAFASLLWMPRMNTMNAHVLLLFTGKGAAPHPKIRPCRMPVRRLACCSLLLSIR